MLDRTESETPRVATGMISIPGGTSAWAPTSTMRKRRRPEPRNRCAEGVLHPGKSRAAAGTTRATIPIFLTSNPAQGDQGRLA
jgi:hypothetical protein